MSSKKNSIIVKIVLIFLLYVLVVGTAFTFLWNWLVPNLFGLQTIHLGQSLGLLLLGRLFFGISTRAGFGKIRKMTGAPPDSIDEMQNDLEREKWRNEWRKMCSKDKDEKEL